MREREWMGQNESLARIIMCCLTFEPRKHTKYSNIKLDMDRKPASMKAGGWQEGGWLASMQAGRQPVHWSPEVHTHGSGCPRGRAGDVGIALLACPEPRAQKVSRSHLNSTAAILKLLLIVHKVHFHFEFGLTDNVIGLAWRKGGSHSQRSYFLTVCNKPLLLAVSNTKVYSLDEHEAAGLG